MVRFFASQICLEFTQMKDPMFAMSAVKALLTPIL